MDERTRSRLIEILESAPEIYLPAGRLLDRLQAEGLAAGLDPLAFLEELTAEPAFEMLGGAAAPAPGAETGVKLASRSLTTEAVLAALAHNLAQLNEALLRAWENRPAGDSQTESMLLEVLARAKELGKEIGEIGGSEGANETGQDGMA